MGKELLGLALCEKSARCVALEEGKDGFKLKGVFEIEYPNFETAIKDRKIAEKIRSFVKRHRFSYASVSLPHSITFTRIKNVPKIPEAKIFKLIQSELKDYAIFKGENIALGFTKVSDEGETQNVLWAAVKEPILLQVLKFLKECGVKANLITIPQIANVFGVYEFFKEENPFAVINADYESTSLTVAKGKQILFNYTQDIGFGAFENNDESLKNTWVGNIISSLTYITRSLSLPLKEVFFKR